MSGKLVWTDHRDTHTFWTAGEGRFVAEFQGLKPVTAAPLWRLYDRAKNCYWECGSLSRCKWLAQFIADHPEDDQPAPPPPKESADG